VQRIATFPQAKMAEYRGWAGEFIDANRMVKTPRERLAIVTHPYSSRGLGARCIEIVVWLSSEQYDPDRHRLLTEMKGVQMHQLLVENRDGKWRARVTFDI
jgi:hypothetical protein